MNNKMQSMKGKQSWHT